MAAVAVNRMPIRILLGDDEQLFRNSTKAILETSGFEVTAEVSDGLDAVAYSQINSPDIALLEVFLPTLNGYDAAQRIVKTSPQTRVVLFTSYLDGAYVRRVMHSPIKGFISKSCSPEVLLSALREIHSGTVYVCAEAVSAAFEQKDLSFDQTPDELTLKEREVLQLIAEGKSTKDVAAILGISAKTAEARRHRISAKLKQRSIACLVRYAVRQGLVR